MHLAAAQVGRAHPRVLLRRLWWAPAAVVAALLLRLLRLLRLLLLLRLLRLLRLLPCLAAAGQVPDCGGSSCKELRLLVVLLCKPDWHKPSRGPQASELLIAASSHACPFCLSTCRGAAADQGDG